MKELLKGFKEFSSGVYPQKKSLFSALSTGQSPHTLLVTCSDSRIDPNLFTQTEPGDIFVVRNAGNLVPAYGASRGGEEPTIEYAMEALKIKNIVVCGHSHCGAMAALKGGVDEKALPAVASWLKHAEGTKTRVQAGKDDSLEAYIKENALAQVETLKAHPSVVRALEEERVKIFAWVYEFENGKVYGYNKSKGRYVDVSEVSEEEIENFSL